MPITTIITLVEAPACHFCADAKEALAELARQHPVRIDVVSADSATGQRLIGEYRPAMFPLVLVDGGFFSAGRLPRHKLQALLTTKPAEVRS